MRVHTLRFKADERGNLCWSKRDRVIMYRRGPKECVVGGLLVIGTEVVKWARESGAD